MILLKASGSKLGLRSLAGSLFVISLLVLSFSPLACSHREQAGAISVQLKTGPKISIPDSDLEREDHFRIGFAAIFSPRETLKHYTGLADYLSTKLGKPVEMVQRYTYSEINHLLEAEEIDLAFVCTFAYVTGQEESYMEALAIPLVSGKREYQSFLITRSNNTYKDLGDFRGKTFAFTDPLSFSGRNYPLYVLWSRGESPETFFSSYIYTYSHDNSIRAVLEGLVEGAAVDSQVYEQFLANHPNLKEYFKVIDSSPPVGNPPFVVNPKMSSAKKEKLREILLKMHLDPEGKKVLERIGFERFVLPQDESYDYIRKIKSEMGS